MKIECEIDWFGEEEDISIDEAIRSAIIEKTVKIMVSKLINKGYDNVEKQTSDALATHVDDLLFKLTDRFMNKEVKVTDKWGDIQEEHESVNELLKTKFDGFLTAAVDHQGKVVTSCSYGKKQTRMEYLIDQRLDALSSTMINSIAAIMDKKIEAKKAVFMAEAGAKMAEKLGLDK